MDHSGAPAHNSEIRVDTSIPVIVPKGVLSHEFLRRCAVKWLVGTKKCSVVISEMHSAAGEIPDAVGWKSGFSILVECKVSRSDLRANQFKTHIRSERGIGKHRYFLVPSGLVSPQDIEDVGDCSTWGLLWIDANSRIKLQRDAIARTSDEAAEIRMLTSALRRVRTREFLTVVQREDELG